MKNKLDERKRGFGGWLGYGTKTAIYFVISFHPKTPVLDGLKV